MILREVLFLNWGWGAGLFDLRLDLLSLISDI